MCPREVKFYVYTKTCTEMSMATFFVICQKWEQPNCPLKGSINHGMLHRNGKGRKYQPIHVNWISHLKQQYLISKG